MIRVGINESRFATRAWACGERVRYPTIFPKSLIRYLMNEGCPCWLSEKDDKGKYRLIFQFIANTSDAFDFNGTICLEVVAETSDVDIQTAEVEVVVVTPEFLQEG